MTVQLHTGSRSVTIGADFLVWDVPCRVVLTDPWQLREAREVLREELTGLDRSARPRAASPTASPPLRPTASSTTAWPPSTGWRPAAAAVAPSTSTRLRR